MALAPFAHARFLRQDQKSAQDTKKAEKERKQKEKDLWKELDPQSKKWVEEDVRYIITPEEYSAFIHLSTNEEREDFKEQFWARRNPDPDSPDNTAKEEHYRRIAYANEHFASGVPGWKTDRGPHLHHVGCAGRDRFASERRRV